MLRVSLTDIMSEDVVSIKDDATIGQAAHILLRFRINGVVITKKNNKDKIVGVLTTTDLFRLLNKVLSSPTKKLSLLEMISKMPAIKIASKSVFGVEYNTDIKRVLAIMHKKNIHTLPVFKNGKLIGVVGRHDILNVAFSG